MAADDAPKGPPPAAPFNFALPFFFPAVPQPQSPFFIVLNGNYAPMMFPSAQTTQQVPQATEQPNEVTLLLGLSGTDTPNNDGSNSANTNGGNPTNNPNNNLNLNLVNGMNFNLLPANPTLNLAQHLPQQQPLPQQNMQTQAQVQPQPPNPPQRRKRERCESTMSPSNLEIRPDSMRAKKLALANSTPGFMINKLNEASGTGEYTQCELIITLYFSYLYFDQPNAYSKVRSCMGFTRSRASIRRKIEKIASQDIGTGGGLLLSNELRGRCREMILKRFWRLLGELNESVDVRDKVFARSLREYVISEGLPLREDEFNMGCNVEILHQEKDKEKGDVVTEEKTGEVEKAE